MLSAGKSFAFRRMQQPAIPQSSAQPNEGAYILSSTHSFVVSQLFSVARHTRYVYNERERVRERE